MKKRHILIHPFLLPIICLMVAEPSLADNSFDFSSVIGLEVEGEDSIMCNESSGNDERQVLTNQASITGGNGETSVKLAITVEGSVENHNAGFDNVYVNDVLFFGGSENGVDCGMITKTVTKEITVDPSEDITLKYDTMDWQHHVAPQAKITKVEVVDCENNCSSCPVGSGSLSNSSIDVSLNLGRADFGKSVGGIRITESVPSPVLGTPSSLQFSSTMAGVVVVRDSVEAIRQVKTPQCLADVITETAARFRVDFYDPANIGEIADGLYNQQGKSSYMSWIIENVDPVNNDDLKVTQVKGSLTILNEYIWDETGQGWEFIKGNGQRKEKKTTVVDTAAGTRVVTTVVKNAADVVVSKTICTYKDFAWGSELIQSVADPDGLPQTTTRTFYDNLATDGTGAYGKPKQVIRPDGSWEKYEYNAQRRKIKTVGSFLDASPTAPDNLCKVTTISYQEAVPQETRIVTILGQEVERRYKVTEPTFMEATGTTQHITKEIVCTVPGAAYDAASNMITIMRVASTGDATGEIELNSKNDGTGEEIEEYIRDPEISGTLTTSVRRGAMADGHVVSGTRTTRIVDIAGNLLGELVVDIASGLTLSQKTIPTYDVFGRPNVIDYNDGTTESITYGCCGVASRTDRDGIITSYTYDVFRRVLTEVRAGITMAYTYDAEGHVLTRSRNGVAQETNVYDLAGWRTSTTDALNHTTHFDRSVDGSGRVVETITYPDAGTEEIVRHRDGRIFTRTGTAVAPRKWLYGVETGVGFYQKEIRLGIGSSESEWTQTWQDLEGRTTKQQMAGRAPMTSHYDAMGHLEKAVDPDGVIMLFAYDGEGRNTSKVLDVNRSSSVNATDQVSLTVYQVVSAHGEVVRRMDSSVVNAAGDEELVTRQDISIDGKRQWITNWGLSTTSEVVVGSNGTKTETITYPDTSTLVRSYTQGRLTSETRHAAGGGTIIKSITYDYDSLGRLETATDARDGTTSYVHDATDRLVSVTTPAPGPGKAAQTTTNSYDEMGRVTAVTLPDNSQILREYFPNGLLKKESGSQKPTVNYTYDEQGRMKTMITSGQAGEGTTTWAYDSQTGWMTGKSYPNGDDLTFTYTQAGLPQTQVSERNITRAYQYDPAGRLTGIDYSDGTLGVTYTINRLGQIVGITDASGTRTRAMTTDGRLLSETHTAGLLDGAVITNGYDALLRRITFSATTGGPTLVVGYTYDSASRLATVVSGADTSTYGYLADSSLIGGLTTTRGGVTSLAITSGFDKLERLTDINASNSTSVVSSNAYSYNDLNQRVESVLEDGSKWNYQYDVLGQVIAGNRKWADNAPVAGSQFGYAFDSIGNRISATVNGRISSYTANTANQYSQRQVPGFLDIRGTAIAVSKVTVNRQATQRQGDTFYKAYSVDNSAAAQFPEIKVLAVQNNAGPNGVDLQSESIGKMFLPQTPEMFTYDSEGNLTSDGRWNYTWDAENRLIRQETLESVPPAAKRKLEYAYDSGSRRIRKQVYKWNGTAWALDIDRRFLYDGWNLVAELDASNAILRNYVWGADLSGTIQGAGGIGGLLTIREGTESYHPTFDGNGNVTALGKASDRSIAARYQYGPFGETLVVEENGVSNPFRFSTKYYDTETGLYYYGFRYYDPVTGRWKSMDPIGEDGGLNLYGFVYNDTLGWVDYLGKDPIPMPHLSDLSPSQYATRWKQDHPKRDTSKDNSRGKQLGRGCVGITCINTGYPGDWPEQDPDSECFKTRALAEIAKKKKTCPCDPKTTSPGGGRPEPVIFSIHLFNNQGKDGKTPDVTFDASGRANMSNWDHQAQAGFVNFDYGFLNSNGAIEHANHGANQATPMRVYWTTPADWTQFRHTDFNEEVWCVKCNYNKS